jgi:hypothetical protein
VGRCGIRREHPPAAKGFRFVTPEDEMGFADAIVKPDLYERHLAVLRAPRHLLVGGVLEREDRVTNVHGDPFVDLGERRLVEGVA